MTMDNRLINVCGIILSVLIISTFSACDRFNGFIDPDDPVIEDLGSVLSVYTGFNEIPDRIDNKRVSQAL